MTAAARDWVLTREAFDRLLQWLDSDPAAAARHYEAMRRGLLKFFECRGCVTAEEQTDRTMDRVARKLAEGVEIVGENRYLYFYGVARNVYQEYLRTLRAQVDIPLPLPEEASAFQRRLDCMEHCLDLLPARVRQMMIEYCAVQKSSKKHEREGIAQRLGLSVNTLRIRVHRVREQLERCVTVCLNRRNGNH